MRQSRRHDWPWIVRAVPPGGQRYHVGMRDAVDWMLDEVASAGRENLDSAHVARYDAKEDAEAMTEVDLLRSFGMNSSSLVLEFGSGTGQFTVAASPAVEHVVAVDPSPPMLVRLREKVSSLNLVNVDTVQSGFLSYEHNRRPVDVVYSRYALHHLPDAWKVVALARIHSMMRVGGILRLWDVVYDFDPAEAPERFERWCSIGSETTEGEWSRAELAEHIRDEHSTFSWLMESMLERSGFRIEHSERVFDGFGMRYLAYAD